MAMNPGMKMLAMAKAGQGGRMERGSGSRMEAGGGQMYGGYNRMAGSEMGGGYNQMTYEPEMRRRRDERGRYMEGAEMRRMERQPETMHDRENPYGDEPDVYKRQHERSRMAAYGGEISYERPDGNRGNIRYFKGAPEMMGFQQQHQQKEHQKERGSGFDKQTAMEWVEHMEDKEGVKGGQYSWHQAQQYGRNLGIVGEERLIEFYAAMNAMYSDFRPVAKKFGVDKPEFYAHMAKCFIEDPDAVEDKVEAYYQHVAKHDD